MKFFSGGLIGWIKLLLGGRKTLDIFQRKLEIRQICFFSLSLFPSELWLNWNRLLLIGCGGDHPSLKTLSHGFEYSSFSEPLELLMKVITWLRLQIEEDLGRKVTGPKLGASKDSSLWNLR